MERLRISEVALEGDEVLGVDWTRAESVEWRGISVSSCSYLLIVT